MDTSINMNFKVTPSEKETITLRMKENGFDELSAYLKVIALNTQIFSITYTQDSTEEASQKLEFNVTQSQKTKIESNMKESECKDFAEYIKHAALHGVITAVVEIRSSGNFSSMVERILNSKSGLK